MVVSILNLTSFIFENVQFSVFKCALFFQVQMKLFIIYRVYKVWCVHTYVPLYTHGVCVYIKYLLYGVDVPSASTR